MIALDVETASRALVAVVLATTFAPLVVSAPTHMCAIVT